MTSDSGINNYFLKKLSKLGTSFDAEEFDILKSRAERLSGMGITSGDKLESYKIMKRAGASLGIQVSDSVYKKAIKESISSQNDAYYILLKDRISNKKIKKVAYPNSVGFNFDVQDEVDIDKWLKTVHLIYDSVQRGEMTKHNALEYYSNFLNIEEEENVRFKKWFKYYSEGEHLKYSSSEEGSMKKSAIYMSNLGQSGSQYTHSRGGFNMPGDSFGGETFDETVESSKAKANNGDAFNSWKNKLHAALRRIDKLLRSQHMDGDKYKMLAEHLLNLSHQVHCLKLASTISDVTHKTANTFEKHGQRDVADMLVKVAQEVPQETGLPPEGAPINREAPTEGGTAPGGADEEQQSAETSLEESSPQAPESDPNDPKSSIPSGDDVDPVSLENITPIPGARQGEYEELAGNVSLDDAANKLDEVAGMLADRRIIRQLAEFDIMLDKIGIASMFPELAESQSKLIDAFSYALTRVTKMMGQLANAKSIIDSKNDLPGRQEQENAGSEETVAEQVEQP